MPLFSLCGKKIYVAGHSGLVGTALVHRLEREECCILTATHKELDLTQQKQTYDFLMHHKPDVVIIAAAKVGGIGANIKEPGTFIYDNLAIATNLIHGAHLANVERLLFLGSSCMYPRDAVQPMMEEALLTGAPEPTNAPYALAKLAGSAIIKAYRTQYKRSYITAIPCNLYGPYDRFEEDAGHVIPALMARAYRLSEKGESTLPVWGAGQALREFLHADDLAQALILLLTHYDDESLINVGSCGQEVTIAWLAHEIAHLAGLKDGTLFDSSRPEGVPRKVIDCKRIMALGWHPRIDLSQGLMSTYRWLCTQKCKNNS